MVYEERVLLGYAYDIKQKISKTEKTPEGAFLFYVAQVEMIQN